MHRLLSGWTIASVLTLLPVGAFFLSLGVIHFYTQGAHPGAIIAAGCVLFICAALVIWFFLSKRRSGSSGHDVVNMVDANPAWGPEQRQAWESVCLYIDKLLDESDQIDALPDHSLGVLRQVATVWHRSGSHLEYAVTLPEALLAIESLAARYRGVLLANVPLANRIKVSQALSMWSFYEKHETTMKYTYGAYRAYRAFSVSGIVSELAGAITGQLSENAQKNLAYNLKRAFLQEVANVAIDLYSGNFLRAIDELPFDQDQQSDLDKLAAEVGPIRIAVVGQISSGKSTLVNAMLEEFKAESGLVPTTDQEAVYQFSITEGLDTHIIDTPGIAADSKAIDQGLQRLTNADLVIWVMRANQPGRNIDQALYGAFERYFEVATDRQKPAVLLAATHIDCIPAFANVSEENLQEVTAPLAQACSKAIQYDAYCPLVLVGQTSGITAFRNTLAKQYERAINTRLNRVRARRPGLHENAAEIWDSLRTGTVAAVKLGLKKRTARTAKQPQAPSH